MTTREKAKEVLEYVLTTAFFCIVLTLVVRFCYVPTASMEPTVEPGSVILTWRLPYIVGNPKPDYRDIIAFNLPGRKELLLKRVIGLPGDVIRFNGTGIVLRNGVAIYEDYLAEDLSSFSAEEEYVVPDGCVFVMGDNRLESADSRVWENPYVRFEWIRAKYLFTLFTW